MEKTLRIYPDRKLIVARFKGIITYEDIIQWFDEVIRHEDFSKEYSGVVDLRSAEFLKAPSGKIHETITRTRKAAQYTIEKDFTKGKWALLADTPMETSLLMIYAKEVFSKHPVSIFSTVEAAAHYLGQKLDDVLF